MTSSTRNVRLLSDELVLGDLRVSFQRTLRIPEHGVHALPPGLGRFPLRRVADFPDTAPESWQRRGGVMLPVYQREAMWLSFSAEVPSALQVGIGKVCAVSGLPWTDTLSQEPQNYVAVPLQPWLDGINSGEGTVRQFVAVRHGLGATVEGQVTGAETEGGVQLAAHALTAEARSRWEAEPRRFSDELLCAALPMSAEMGLGAGGMLRQEIYDDERPVTDYQLQPAGRVFVQLCSASQWRAITGEEPPVTPVSARAYTEAGLPWFDYYDADAADLPSSQSLSDVKPVGEWLGDDPDLDGLGQPKWVVPTGPDKTGAPVVDGDW